MYKNCIKLISISPLGMDLLLIFIKQSIGLFEFELK